MSKNKPLTSVRFTITREDFESGKSDGLLEWTIPGAKHYVDAAFRSTSTPSVEVTVQSGTLAVSAWTKEAY